MTSHEYTSGNLSLKSAQQMLEIFYNTYSVNKVKLVLLQSFQAYVLNDKKGFLDLSTSEQEVGEVFDGLIGLVGAVQELIDEGKIEGLGSKR